MRILFVSYCFGDVNGQVLIGVYKRSLRIALELRSRDHEVVMYCTGREAYHDQLTEAAEKQIIFEDIPFSEASYEEAEKNRLTFLNEISRINPDLMVVGEAPLAGALLDSTLAAVELEIPVLVLDNAYNPLFARHFYLKYSTILDGIILSGPTSFQQQVNRFPFLHQVPPYIESSPDIAGEFLNEIFDSKVDKLMTVLAYDGKVEKLGISLLEKLDIPGLKVLFLSRDPQKCLEKLKDLPEVKRKMARAIMPPADPLLFGLLELSRLSVVKHGFMQVSECMALRTPVILVYYEGPRWLEYLPEACRPFAFFTSASEADTSLLEAAQKFLNMNPEKMSAVHNGEFGAAAKAVDFIESFPLKQRQETGCSITGNAQKYIFDVLEKLHPGKKVTPFLVRYLCIRILTGFRLYTIVCGCSVDGTKKYIRLWGRLYDSREAAEENFREEYAQDSKRQVYFFSADEKVLVEADVGQSILPRL